MNILKANKKLVLVFFILFLSIFCFSSCTSSKVNLNQDDIMTLKPLDDDKIDITVSVKYAFSFDSFETILEEKFPDVNLVQVGNYTANTVLAKEYETQLKHDDLSDIILTWPLDRGEEYWDDRLLDLAGLPFSSNYNTSALDAIAKDGKLYYIPGPAELRGIVYNKTLFEEKGWEVPQNYDEFLALCKRIEASGMRALELGFGNKEVLDTAFIGFHYSQSFATPSDMQWIFDYNEGKGKFIDHFEPALSHFQSMIDQGIFQKEDTNLFYQDTQRDLFTRKTAMIADGVLTTHMGEAVAGSTDEFAIFPFFNPSDIKDWVRLQMVCYIGLNQHLLDAGNEEKYEKVMEIMEFISSEEGQLALAKDAGAMFSSLVGVSAPDVPEIKDLQSTLKQGRYVSFPEFANASQALRDALYEMLRGNLTPQQVAEKVDIANLSHDESNNHEVLATAMKDFTMIDTGHYVCDAMRKEANSEIALFLDNGKDGTYNGKGISAKFYQGDVTDDDIDRIYPDIKHGELGELWIVEMSGKDLLDTLEYTIEVDQSNHWFYYFSGLQVAFNPTAEMGHRVQKATIENGNKIELDRLYQIAVMDETIPSQYIQTCDKTGIKIKDVIKEALLEDQTIAPSNDQRFTIIHP